MLMIKRSIAGGGLRRISEPIGVGLWKTVQHANHAPDDVIDLGEVAAVISAIEDINWCSRFPKRSRGFDLCQNNQ